ncbi:HEAT repeat domain-containing protein [Xanthocytophaga agilis]|uniref:HEAT repeat domain-containing protein n=1 Tax=Xanthocytophaga agilis TaxID=3048010 RepID=A0AAE3UGQ1_9BACT|nr:HEAT repeat domain-containing protein [Xanthocytophaga agilis]MDJ1504585.1 HEAT repeat domain-containing protein [Xanthocytophaga agilis]
MEVIEALLEKYWEGETTIAEERRLKEYFTTTKDIPAHLAIYKDQFSLFSEWKKEEELSEDFDAQLSRKIQTEARVLALKPRMAYWQWAAGIAAGVTLFVIGFYSGKQNPSGQPQLSDLQNEMKKLRETVVVSQLKQTSASERIKGVNYVYDMKEKSPEVIDALIETLNTDENSNVRLAAANALFTFKDVSKARTALIESIKKQEDPSVKIALINIMIAMKDKKAKPAIEDFLKKEPIPQNIKESIRKELQSI